jgi:peptidoglycan/xylan/chitin deacetylase (PgdA/CDA1 family)
LLNALACKAVEQELLLVNSTSGAELWATVFHPDDASEQRKYPAVVFIPGGMGFGSSAARSPMPAEFTRTGFVLGLFDPDGRGRSRGWENWNGKVHQDGLHDFLKRIASIPFVDKNNIGVVSSSLGLAMAAGALGRYPSDPPVKYFIDIEGPTDRFYITGKDNPWIRGAFGGRTTDDVEWWVEREAVRTIPNMVCPYLRLQWEHDHVHGPDKGHAMDIINATTSAKHGGKGKSEWTRINGPENPPNTVFTKDKPPQWIAGRQDHRQTEVLLPFLSEMASMNKPPITNHESRVTNPALITFAVNTHDWPHLDESAATVLRLVGIFEKNKVRGDFYFTPQIVEHYEQKRPDVIQRLKQSGMSISYHVRPPHPTYGGFDARLRNLDDAVLAKTLRDYETYRLDPATGELQRDKPGGYSYVSKVFGCKPVVVSPQCRDPRIRAAALNVYIEMGAKMVVAYHENGTKLEQPFEWVQGLLARPSDFSITRWAVGGRPEMFWWNMLDTPNAAAFNPTARLKSQLATWKGSRPPFITVLIHENDFSRSNGTGWGDIYFTGEGRKARPKQPPFDLNAPDLSRPRSVEAREKIWTAYEAMVTHAAANLRVATSEEIVAMARR